jgi:hypothetical protein
LQALDYYGLVGGGDVGLDLVDARADGHRAGGDGVVAGQHEDADALAVQGADGLGRGGLDRIGDGERPG